MGDFIRNFLSNDAGPVAQFIKYAFVGGVATGVNIIVFYLVGWRLVPSLSANDAVARLVTRFTGLKAAVADEVKRARNAIVGNVVAFFASNTVCYILNRLFVFVPGRHGVAVEVLMFFGSSAASLLVGTTIQTRLIKKYHMQTTLAFSANIVASLAINYVLRKFVIFQG